MEELFELASNGLRGCQVLVFMSCILPLCIHRCTAGQLGAQLLSSREVTLQAADPADPAAAATASTCVHRAGTF